MQGPSPKLRRAWLAGYRVADVELALAQFGLRVSQLWTQLQDLKERLETTDRERRDLERRLGEAHARELELLAGVANVRGAQEREQSRAHQEAQAIVDAAHLDAAHIRAEAARESETVRAQVDQLLKLRDTLSGTMRAVVRDFEGLVGTIDRPHAHVAPVEVHAAMHVPPSPPPAAAALPVTTSAPAPRDGGEVFDGRVEVSAGPFTDFASLSAFERALGSIPKVEDVYVRRFEGDRATIDLTLEAPAPLLDEMSQRMPYNLAVDHAGVDRIAVTVSATG